MEFFDKISVQLSEIVNFDRIVFFAMTNLQINW